MQGLRRAVRALVPAVLLLTLAGCAGDAAPSRTFEDCGAEQQQMGTNLNVDGRACLLAAFEAGRPAHFVSRITTIEGAPIVRTYRVLSADLVEVEWDNRQDPLGSGKIDVLHCPRLVPVADSNEAMSDEVRAEEVFVEDGCQQVASRANARDRARRPPDSRPAP
jgi:hypothetical protein